MGSGCIRLLRGLFLVLAVALPNVVMGGVDLSLTEGNALLERQEYSRAARAFESAIARGSKDSRAYGGLGRSYLRLGSSQGVTNLGLLGKAAEALRRAKELDPADARVRFDLGIALLALGDRQGAEGELASLKELDGGLADELSKAVAGHQPTPSYRLVGEGGAPTGNVTPAGNITPLEIIGNTVIVPVTLSYGSRSVQARLILDTGSTITSITPEVASLLEMRLDQAVTGSVQVVGGGMVEARGVRLERVAVGPHAKSGMNVAVISNKGSRLQHDGLLGMDFLRGLHYRVDFDGRALHWIP